MAGTYQSDMKLLLRSTVDLAEKAADCCSRLERLDDFEPEQVSEMYSILNALHREALNDVDSLKKLTADEDSAHV